MPTIKDTITTDVDIEIEVEVYCNNCGAHLCNETDSVKTKNRSANAFRVNACPKCLDNSYEKGYDKAREEYEWRSSSNFHLLPLDEYELTNFIKNIYKEMPLDIAQILAINICSKFGQQPCRVPSVDDIAIHIERELYGTENNPNRQPICILLADSIIQFLTKETK